MKRSRILVFVLIFVVIVQLAIPYSVLADDETPPPQTTEQTQPADSNPDGIQPVDFVPVEPEQPTDVIPTEPEQSADVIPTEPEQPTDVIPTETDQSANVIPTEPEQPANVIPAETDQSADVIPTEPEQSADVIPTETDQSADVIPAETDQSANVIPTEPEQPANIIPAETDQSADVVVEEMPTANFTEALPKNTDVIVLDENNLPVPLVTESAANAIANNDPAWCPDGTSLAVGDCTNYPNFSSLISGLHSLSSPQNGIVYIQAGTYSGPESSITFDGSYLPNVGNLSLLGGWDLTAAHPVYANSTIFSIPLSFTNWTHDISIQDIQVNNTQGSGLSIDTTGDVSLQDVIANHNKWDGIFINGEKSVTMQNVETNYNGDDGIDIRSHTNDGTITLDMIQASHNGDNGIYIYSKAKSVISLTNIVADYNGGDGLHVQSPVETEDCLETWEGFVPAGGTWGVFTYEEPTVIVGIECHLNPYQTLIIGDSEFNNNGENGIFASTSGAFFIGFDFRQGMYPSPVTANGNGQRGGYFHQIQFNWAFPEWSSLQAHADELAGGPVKLFVYYTPFEPSFSWNISPLVFTSNGNHEPDDINIGTNCELVDIFNGGIIGSCWLPIVIAQITGGEQINTGESTVEEDPINGNSDSTSGDENEASTTNDDEKEDDSNNAANPNEGSTTNDEKEVDSNNAVNPKDTSLCAQNSVTTLELPDGNSLTVFCPMSGILSVKSQTKKTLPAPLPNEMTFVAGLNVTLSHKNAPTPFITESGHLKPSFVIPTDMMDKDLVILYWDRVMNAWVELPAFGSERSVSLSNGGTVLEGVQLLNNIGQIEVGVNFPGIFVFAVK